MTDSKAITLLGQAVADAYAFAQQGYDPDGNMKSVDQMKQALDYVIGRLSDNTCPKGNINCGL